MAGNTVDIYLRGHNQASPAIQQVSKDIGGLDKVAQTVTSSLGALGGIVGVAGVAALGGVALRAAADLGALGERVARSEKYFTAFSGSAQAAAANLEAMKRATDGAISTQEAMNAGASIMGMGLAKNAQELEQFARMAVLLGGNTRTATEAINEFQLLIANQSILRLDTFDISGAKVRARIEELQAATKGMTREAAFMAAVMEEGSKKVEQLEAAGVKAGTSQDRLAAATADLKAELSKLVEQPYTVTVEFITKGVNALTFAASKEGGDERNYGKSFDAYKAAVEGTQYAQEVLNNTISGGEPAAIAYAQALLTTAQANEELARKAFEAAQGVQDFNLNGASVPAIASNAAASMLDLAGAMERVADAASRPGVLGQQSANAWYSDGGDFYQAITDNKIAEDARYAREVRKQRDDRLNDEKRAAETSAKNYASAYNAEMQKVSGRIQGYLSQGISASVGLKDMKGDIFKPGANGPFENLFRTLDVANLGSASPWAAKLGLTQEQAKKISEDFQRGIFSPEVMGLVDTDALVNEAKMAELAEKTQAAFAEKIAQKAGVKTNLVSNLFGYGSTGEGEKSGAVAEKQADEAMNKVATSVGDTVNGKDFAGKIIGYGDTIWGYFEKGIVDSAKQSSALQAAIDGMVANALANRGANGAQGSARSQGVPGV